MRAGVFALVALVALTSGAIELFNGKDLSGWYTYLQGKGRNCDPDGDICVTNGVIRMSGRGFGALVSDEAFSNYRLRVEYRFLGGEQFGWKKGWAPDSGILFHSTGPDGAFEGMWMESLEMNLIKGATGDFWSVGAPGKDTVALSCRAGARRHEDRFAVYDPQGAEVFTITGNTRVCRMDIDPDWRDRYETTVASNENPIGEWNVAELVCRGDEVTAIFNGKVVNRGFGAKPTSGRIQLQMEGCPIEFRRVTLDPLLPNFETAAGDFREGAPMWHIQGIAIGEDAVYMCEGKALFKFDLETGRRIKAVPVPLHSGDICLNDGRIYCAVAYGVSAGEHSATEHGRITVYDTDLNLIAEKRYPELFDGITALDGVLYVGVCTMERQHHRKCRIMRVDQKTLDVIDVREIDPGFEMEYGVQDMATDGRNILMAFYAYESRNEMAVYTKDLEFVSVQPFSMGHGFDFMPTRFDLPGRRIVAKLDCFRDDPKAPATKPHGLDIRSRFVYHTWDGKDLKPICAHVVRRPAAFEPTVVATPPTFAVRDLCVTADGEIRHYGWRLEKDGRRRVYVASRNGFDWTTRIAAENDVGAMVKSPYGEDWIYWRMKGGGGMEFLRSKVGPGDICAERVDYPWSRLELRQLLAMKSRRRWVAAFSDVTCVSNECYHATVALSDDDGRTWRRVDLKPVAGVERMAQGDKRPHWFNNGCEPSVVELKDGALLLAVRTSGPHAAFYRSEDGGETWSEGTPDPSFWQANTMPYLFRLHDGRLLFIWNNTQMLPTRDASEYPELDAATLRGEWESVFTNRDALHAAISEDDGKTWKGFREVILNPIRNASDFRQLGNGPLQEHDKSVHQTQAVELPDGKVLLSLGQNIAARRLVVIDPEWLYETGREEDFRHGLENLSTHLYVKSLTGGWRGFAGHCAWNRAPGAMLVRDPDTGRETQREVLQLCRIPDPRLVSDRQGIVWNFPAARRGRFETECRIDGEGFRLALTDHWINPCDETNPQMSPVAVDITADRIGGGEWHRLVCEWDEDRGVFTVACGNFRLEGRMTAVPKFGLSYAHLQTLSESCNPKGAYFRSFSMSAVQDNDDTRRK